jgi:hypothetical protein
MRDPPRVCLALCALSFRARRNTARGARRHRRSLPISSIDGLYEGFRILPGYGKSPSIGGLAIRSLVNVSCGNSIS